MWGQDIIDDVSFNEDPGADWPAVRREKVRESMETFAFLSISAHWFTFSTIFGPVWSNCARAEKYSQSAPAKTPLLNTFYIIYTQFMRIRLQGMELAS